jgi:hypothetical protein
LLKTKLFAGFGLLFNNSLKSTILLISIFFSLVFLFFEKQLAEDKKRGYSEMGNASMSKIINAIHYTLGVYPIKSTTFSPADVPEYVDNNYAIISS